VRWIREIFGVEKPIIAMCHLRALPGDPGYDASKGLDYLLTKARADLRALQSGGVDAVLFSNEYSTPYLLQVEPITHVTMARIIGELLCEIAVPYGVNVLWDPKATIELAVATGASFVREIFTGVYASDFGLWNTHSGETVRLRNRLGGERIKLFYNIVPEAAVYLGNRDLASIARSTVFNTQQWGRRRSLPTRGFAPPMWPSSWPWRTAPSWGPRSKWMATSGATLTRSVSPSSCRRHAAGNRFDQREGARWTRAGDSLLQFWQSTRSTLRPESGS
jgi:hypothetical protein